jgi:hypothetical protein
MGLVALSPSCAFLLTRLEGMPTVIDAKNFFKSIKNHPERFYIIHYSSQSLYDAGLDALSPRITSIVIMHYETRQTVSFALHAVAEELGIAREDVPNNYDDIERVLLERFFTFVRDRRQQYWVHWNMRNLTYGFEHLEHRYRLLVRQEPPMIPVEVRLNLNDMLKDRYGAYAKDPKMKNLMLLNGDLDTRFLEGAQEAEAFKSMEFIRMHSSTISKVEFFRYVIVQALRGKLRTAGNQLVNRIDRLLDSRSHRVFAFVALVAGFFALLLRLGFWLFN